MFKEALKTKNDHLVKCVYAKTVCGDIVMGVRLALKKIDEELHACELNKKLLLGAGSLKSSCISNVNAGLTPAAYHISFLYYKSHIGFCYSSSSSSKGQMVMPSELPKTSQLSASLPSKGSSSNPSMSIFIFRTLLISAFILSRSAFFMLFPLATS